MRETGRRVVAALLACGLAVAALPTSALATQDAEMGEEPPAAQTQADRKEERALPSADVPELGVEVQAAPPAEEPQGHQPLATQAKDIGQLRNFATVQDVVYNRQNPVFPTCKITDSDGKTLVENVDYKLEYKPIYWPYITLNIEGINEYADSHLYLSGTARVDASYFKIDKIPDQDYTGGELKPAPIVKFGTITLVPWDGTYGDYNVTYKNNVAPGIATATITTRGKSYSGSRDVTFAIKGSPAQFADVAPTHWAKGVVDEATSLGLFSGYGNGNFGIDDHVTRDQVAVVLWCLAGRPAPGAGARAFDDVKSETYYYDAVRWASSVGVVSGYADGRFGIGDRITREQFAAMLGNYASHVAGREVAGTRADFASMGDKDKVSPWAVPSVGWCFRNGILSGSGGNVLPQGYATRGQAAKMAVLLRAVVK